MLTESMAGMANFSIARTAIGIHGGPRFLPGRKPGGLEGTRMIPGGIITKPGDSELNAGPKTVTLTVAKSGDRPIQVASHYHFFETNRHCGRDGRALRARADPGGDAGGGPRRLAKGLPVPPEVMRKSDVP
jgi:Urease beta subunit